MSYDENFRSNALCRGIGPEIFYPPQKNTALVNGWASQGKSEKVWAEARALCLGCPVRMSCAAFAVAGQDADGMWGGLTPRERQQLQRKIEERKAA